MKIELTEAEWGRLLNAAALAPFNQIADLIAKVGEQIQKQKAAPPANE
jgi:hypothetical protein